MRDSCVYWIHLPTHTNMLEQGYIGITSQPFAKRIQQHKTAALRNKLPIHRAILKHSDNLVFEKILIGSLEYCLLMENRLRPVAKTAWNVGIGGSSTTLGRVMPDSEKLNLSLKIRGRKMSEEFCQTQSVAGKKRGVPRSTIEAAAIKNAERHSWKNTVASGNASTWLIADEIHAFMAENPQLGSVKVSQQFNTTKSKIAVVFKKIRAGWCPKQDDDWLNFRSTMLTPDTLE